MDEKEKLSVPISRREFVAATVTAAGFVLFDLPGRAYASDCSGVCDSLGNLLELSEPVTKVVPMGIYAQTLMETLFPEALSSLAKEVSSDSSDFEEAGLSRIVNLPETGTPKGIFGKNADFEQVRSLDPDLVLQVGFGSEDRDRAEVSRIQAGVGVRTAYLDISYGKLPEAYRSLGRILNCEERANELAEYVEDACSRAVKAARFAQPGLTVFYGPRVAGKKVSRGVWVQVEALKALGFAPVISPYDFKKRMVDFGVLEEESPDFVIFDDTSFPDEFFLASGEVYGLWKDIPAVGNGRFAVAPALMHSILGSAVFAQSIGMLWMASVLAPQSCGLDMPGEMRVFYDLFYGLRREEASMAVLLNQEGDE